MAAGPPEGWTVDEKEGDCHVILSREAPGNQGETVEISVMASDDAIDTIALDEEVNPGAAASSPILKKKRFQEATNSDGMLYILL